MEAVEALEKELVVIDQRLAKGEKMIESTPSDAPNTGQLTELYERLKKRKVNVNACLMLLKDEVIVLPTISGDLLLVDKSGKLGKLLTEAERLGVIMSRVVAKGIREAEH